MLRRPAASTATKSIGDVPGVSDLKYPFDPTGVVKMLS
jgi:hypothetical protein